MRITIEPTSKEQTEGTKPASQYPKLVIEYPNDHLDLETWINMFRSLLLHVGYTPETVREVLPND